MTSVLPPTGLSVGFMPPLVDELAELLGEPRHVAVPERILRRALQGDVPLTADESPVRRWGQLAAGERLLQKARERFRRDLHPDALQGMP